MTCQTDDPEREAAYLAFVRDIEPKLKPHPERDPEPLSRRAGTVASCPRHRYAVFDRALENRRALFREANIPRETQLAELEQQYQKIIGRDDRDVPRRGTHAGPDGPVPRGDRPIRPPGGLGAFRQPPACRTARPSTTCSTR